MVPALAAGTFFSTRRPFCRAAIGSRPSQDSTRQHVEAALWPTLTDALSILAGRGLRLPLIRGLVATRQGMIDWQACLTLAERLGVPSISTSPEGSEQPTQRETDERGGSSRPPRLHLRQFTPIQSPRARHPAMPGPGVDCRRRPQGRSKERPSVSRSRGGASARQGRASRARARGRCRRRPGRSPARRQWWRSKTIRPGFGQRC